MNEVNLGDLQESVQDKNAFNKLNDYLVVCQEYLNLVKQMNFTRIVSPSHSNYIFYQYGKLFQDKITRPLNTDLFIESRKELGNSFERVINFLDDLKKYREKAFEKKGNSELVRNREIDKVVYTIQQAIGCIGDSFENPNQCRKRVGQLFENIIRMIIQKVGIECEPRSINIPIPGYPGYEMSYELDLVFSRDKVILTSETKYIHPLEVVGSIKTTSKDRIDKIFLDKYILNKLIGRNIQVIAIFLHDVQRARRGQSIFGINSTFKSNHFLGYTVALNKLDGVYYVDPRPDMMVNERLREQISDFQKFLIRDLWILSGK